MSQIPFSALSRAFFQTVAAIALFSGSVFAQDQTASFYAGGKEYPLLESTGWVAVKIAPGASATDVRAALNRALPVDASRNGIFHSRYGILVQPVQDAGNKATAARLQQSVASVEGVERPVRMFFNGRLDPIVETDEFLIQFTADIPRGHIEEMLAQHGAEIARPLGSYAPNGYVVRMRDPGHSSSIETANKLHGLPGVIYSHPNFIWPKEEKFIPNDPLFSQQWHLKNTGANGPTGGVAGADVKTERAWEITRGSSNVVVAIVDNGVATDHEDFNSPNKIQPGWDFVDNDNTPVPGLDSDNHGTSCAGLAVANGNNGIGVSGVAPGCRLMSVRLLGANETPESEAAAISSARDNGAAVISNSWGPADRGGPNGTSIAQPIPDNVSAAINDVTSNGRDGKGCIVLWAAGNGNESVDLDGYASHPRVICVAATNNRDQKASYSDFGNAIDVCAPGSEADMVTVDRMGAKGYNPGNYTFNFNGTSAATPVAAGVAALLLSKEPNLTREQLTQRLIDTAEFVDTANVTYDANGHHPWYGFGRVDAWRALSTNDGTNPAVTIRTPTAGMSATAIDSADGTATDTGLGVYNVQVALSDPSDQWYKWDGGGWSTPFDPSKHLLDRPVTSGAWSATLPTLSSGSFRFHAKAIDKADNGSEFAFVDFSIDTSGPSVTISQPQQKVNYTAAPQASGTAFDNIATKSFALFREDDGLWFNWSSSAFDNGAFNGATHAKIVNDAAQNWTFGLPSITEPGTYELHVLVTDTSGRSSSWTRRDFRINRPPELRVITPAHAAGIRELVNITGEVTDPGGIGFVNDWVNFTLYCDGQYWNGDEWTSTQSVLHAPINGGSWTFSDVPTGSNDRSGEYFISANVVDRYGAASIPTPGVNQTSFRIDRSPPHLAISSPANGATFKQQLFQFNGTAEDTGGIERVVLFIRRNSDGLYWNGSGWVANAGSANLATSFNSDTGEWNCIAERPVPGYPPRNMPNGSYNFIAIAIDKAGNQTQSDSQIFVDYHRIMTWEGLVSGDWDNAANWNSKDLGAGLVIPDDSAIVIVNNGRTISTNQNRTVYSVRLQDGRIEFTNGSSRTLTTLRNSTWSGGSFGGTWNVANGATLELVGERVKFLSDGAVVNNFGEIIWGGPGAIQAEGNGFIDNPIINNKAGGVFQVTAGGTLFSRASGRSGVPVFNNEAGAQFIKVEPVLVPGYVGTNLLENGDAEAGGAAGDYTSIVPPSGWTAEGAMTSVLYSIGGPNDPNSADSAAVNGRSNYFAGGPGSLYSYATQTVDVSPLSIQIDAGQLNATLSGFFGGYLDQADNTELEATFLDEIGTPIAGTSTGRVSPADRGGATQLLPRSATTHVPTGTRSVRITLAASRQAGDYNDGFADNLKFEIGGIGVGTGPLVIDTFIFNNSGEMRCDTGVIAFNTSTKFINAGVLSGAGRFELQGGSLTLKGALLLDNTVFRVDLGDFAGDNDGSAAFLTNGNGEVQIRGGRVFGRLTNTEGSRILLSDPEIGVNRKYFVDGCVIDNFGTIIWTGGGAIQAQGLGFADNVIFNNKSGGRFEVRADGTVFSRDSGRAGTPVFNNEAGALFIKNGGSGAANLTTFELNNYGQITAQNGGFLFNTGVHFFNAPALNGPGYFEMRSGRLDVLGSLSLTSNTMFTLLGGDVVAGAGGTPLVSNVADKLRFKSGRLFGTFNVPTDSYLALDAPPSGSAPTLFVDGLVLNNQGTITWTGGAPILAQGLGFAENPIFNNKSGGRFEIAADGAVFNRESGRAGTPLFMNEAGALFVKTAGTGTSLIDTFNFTNRGDLRAETGVFSFNTLFDYASNSSLGGAGRYEIAGGTMLLAGALAIADTTFTLANGIVQPNGSNTTLTSTGTGKFLLLGGEYRGQLTLTSGSRLEFADPQSGPAVKYFQDGSVFDNYGTVMWPGGGKIQVNGYSGPNFVFNNKSGATFEVRGGGELFSRANFRDGTPVFNNETGALFRKTAGDDLNITVFQFNNYGQMSTTYGNIAFNTGVLFSNAAPLIGAGCYYEMRSGRFDLVGALNSGNSTFTVIGDEIFAGANAAFVAPAFNRLRLHGGRYYGTFDVPAGSYLDFGNEPGTNNVKFFGDGSIVNNRGNVAWRGPGAIQAEGNGFSTENLIWNNKTGAKFEIAAAGNVFSRASGRNGIPQFNNESSALVRKTAAGDALIDTFRFDNRGGVVNDLDTLSFNTLAYAHDGATYSGAGIFRMADGQFDTDGTVTFSNAFSILRGEVFGPSSGFTSFATNGVGLLRWAGGRLSGRFALTAGSQMLIDDGESATATEKDLSDGTVFDNYGTIGWAGAGPIQAGGYGFAPNPIFNNNEGAVFNAVPSGGIFNRESYRDGTPQFNNAGAIHIGAPIGVLKFEGWNFAQTNTGRLHVEVGGTNGSVPQYDQLQVAGFATLGGTLVIDLINGFHPAPADAFDLITYSGHSGEFATVHTLGSVLDLAYNASSVHAVAKAFPRDNLEWKRYFFGDPTSPEAQPNADPNNNGLPNLLEYALGRDPRGAGGAPLALGSITPNKSFTESVVVDGVRYNSFSYLRPGGAARLTDITYAGQRTTSISNPNWSSTDTVEQSAVLDPATSLEKVTVRSTHPMSESPKEFLRLSVSLNANP